MLRQIAISALFASTISAQANASLIGDTINATGVGLSPASATIGVGDEFNFLGLEFFDFGATTLTIHGSRGGHSWGDFGFFTFSDFDSVITGLSIASNTGYSGDPLSGFSFTADSITLHWGIGGRSGIGELVFNIETAAVPEPATLALIGLGLAGIGWSRRMRSPRMTGVN